ncbi:hypothetical protein Tco_0726753 [Tanacetum coccineum]|uniref:Uncharacterized protein n=1 Tax=Tanacetum coccineum TaxID=301880 RepID=A0ABQ4YIY9_9ASTR
MHLISGVFYCIGGVIGRAIDKGIQDGMVNGIDHGKAGQGLAKVAAYNPVAEADYISAVSALYDVDFPLLAQLASHKDVSMSDIMDLLRWEGPAAETQEAVQLQPKYFLSSGNGYDHCFIHQFHPDQLVPPVFVANYKVSDVGPSTKVPSPPTIIFEKETLKTTPKHGASD